MKQFSFPRVGIEPTTCVVYTLVPPRHVASVSNNFFLYISNSEYLGSRLLEVLSKDTSVRVLHPLAEREEARDVHVCAAVEDCVQVGFLRHTLHLVDG